MEDHIVSPTNGSLDDVTTDAFLPTGPASTSATAGDSVNPEGTASRFYIPAAEVQQLLVQQGMDEDALLRSLIEPVSRLARPYISKFNVGYVVIAPSSNDLNQNFEGACDSSVHDIRYKVSLPDQKTCVGS